MCGSIFSRPYPWLLAAFLILFTMPADASAALKSTKTGNFVKTAPLGATYTLHIPEKYEPRKGATMLLWLHGAGDNHVNVSRAFLSQRFKPEWIVVFPDAQDRGRWQAHEFERVMDVVDEVEKEYAVRRLFIGGFSRGGFFTFGFGLKRIDRFAGFLCVSGGLSGAGLVKKTDADKYAVAIIHGDADDVVPHRNGVQAKETFEKAGWKELLFFRSVPGLAHRIDRKAMQDAFDWLDRNAQALNTPDDYFDYGMKMYGEEKYARAFQALSGICTEENGKRKWYRKAVSTLKKIESKSVSAGKKVKKLIEADRDRRWVASWLEYNRDFNGTPFHGEVERIYIERKAVHDEQAAALAAEAAKRHEAGDVKGAIEACLDIRDRWFLAESDGKERAKELLAAYRADPEIARKFRRFLKGTEEWR